MRDRFALFMDVAISNQKRAATETTPDEAAPPSDCVRQFPTMNPETIELVAFDSRNVPQLKIELPADEDVALWSEYLLRWSRRRERRKLKASMRAI